MTKRNTILQRFRRTLIEDITVLERLRPIDHEHISRLANSIKSHGLRTPVTLRWKYFLPDETNANEGSDLTLVSGLRRLEALSLTQKGNMKGADLGRPRAVSGGCPNYA